MAAPLTSSRAAITFVLFSIYPENRERTAADATVLFYFEIE